MNKKKLVRSRNYCFTDFELLDLEPIFKEYSDIIRYICRGVEKCPTTGKVHHQGWVQFKNSKRFRGAKSIFGTKKINIRACRGDEFDNDIYCKKDNDFLSFGKFVAQGQRTDLEFAIKLIEQGNTITSVAKSNPQLYIQYNKGLEKYKNLCDRQRQPKWREVEVVWISGATGVGKTRTAMEQATYLKDADNKWWDGYDGDDCVCIDEYNNDMKITKLLRLLDGHPRQLEYKGGTTPAMYTKIYVTTNLRWDEVHPNAKPAQREALLRRIGGEPRWHNVPP